MINLFPFFSRAQPPEALGAEGGGGGRCQLPRNFSWLGDKSRAFGGRGRAGWEKLGAKAVRRGGQRPVVGFGERRSIGGRLASGGGPWTEFLGPVCQWGNHGCGEADGALLSTLLRFRFPGEFRKNQRGKKRYFSDFNFHANFHAGGDTGPSRISGWIRGDQTFSRNGQGQ